MAGRDLLESEGAAGPAHVVQVGDAPAFAGDGSADLDCRCGESTLIKGYLPANYLGIRIQCFRCGAITVTPGLPDGEILPRHAVGIERSGVPAVTPSRVERGAVLACQDEIARGYALTRPHDAPADALSLTLEQVASIAAEYDRLTGGRLEEHTQASPPAMGSELGVFPFAWAVARLRQQIARPGWTWFRNDDDALAAMHVAAMRNFLQCWGQHPLLERLAAPLAERGRFLRSMTGFATAKMLFDAGNQVGFTLPVPARNEVQLHFASAAGEPLTLALADPDALQWRERNRRSPQVLRAAVIDALAAAQGRVNSRNPGIVVLSASILHPEFDQMLVDAIHAAFRSAGRKHRGVAAVGVVMPKVFPAVQPERVAFAYAFYPLRNPHFAGENPIRLGSQEDFATMGTPGPA